jgi:hypothetical protein
MPETSFRRNMSDGVGRSGASARMNQLPGFPVTRRFTAGLAIGAMLSCMPLLAQACDAAEIADTTIGLFREAAGGVVPAGAGMVRTSGFDLPGTGGALYVHHAAGDRDYVARHPRSAFLAADGRGFRLQVSGPIDPQALGLRLGLGLGHARRNREAIAQALELSRRLTLPAGDIDFQAEDGFTLPPLDDIDIAGQGWTTRIVTRDSAFLIPTLSRLTIRDLWIEQTATANAAIQSFHSNLRDIRLLRLKITMRDQATCRNNCIGLVMDGSPPGPDGVVGLKGLLVEDCWLAPGRMGMEIQNHRLGDDKRKLYAYRDVTVRGCTIWKAPAFMGMGISLSGWGTDCLISRNRFVACHNANVEIIGSDRTTVVDNVFEDAIGVPVTASNFRVVKECRILRNRTAGKLPRVVLYLQAMDGAEVAGNVMGTTGTVIVKGANIRIHDNTFTGVGTTQLMQLDNARGVIVEKNRFVSTGAAPPQSMVLAFNDTRGCTIRFNRMERADNDVHRSEIWFFQAPPARGSVAYGNDRRGRGGRVVEPVPPRRAR